MNKLIITILSVGNGDSIFLEYRRTSSSWVFGLIDCNDSVNLKSTHIFLKRFFEMRGMNRNQGNNIFDFIMLSHAHADHISGLQNIIKTYGVDTLYHSRTIHWGGHAPFLKYINRSSLVNNVEAVDDNYPVILFGSVNLSIIWPLSSSSTSSNENNNSIVAVLRHLNNQFVFSGDAEYNVWNDPSIIRHLGSLNGLQVFKVPHHGADNGTIDPVTQKETWPNKIQSTTFSVISSHVKPYGHPDQSVVNRLSNSTVLNTKITGDQNIEFTSDGNQVTVKYFQ